MLSRQENRCVLTFEVLTRFDLASCCFGTVLRDLTAYKIMILRWGASQVPAKTCEGGLLLPQSGGSSLSLVLSCPPRSFIIYPDSKLHCQPKIGYLFSLPPLSSFWVNFIRSFTLVPGDAVTRGRQQKINDVNLR
jgi:hypothetical protein